jgi:signal transduction histidine kinase
MNWFNRLTLTRQFLVASFPIVLAGMLVIGFWVEREIERGVVTRLGEVQSLYVDALVAPHLDQLLARGTIDAEQKAKLDALLTDTALGQKIVAFIIWRPDGRVLYSNEAKLIGRRFPVSEGLAVALAGNIHAKVIERSTQSHQYATRAWPDRLIETYAPIHAEAMGQVLGAAEFYQTTGELEDAMRGARRRSWGVVAVTMFAMYFLLFSLVRRGSQTIVTQQQELHDRVGELSSLLAANAQLDAKVRRAAARTTALNEQFLRRVAVDLHDGPAQDLGFALMRLESMATAATAGAGAGGQAQVTMADLQSVRSAIEGAMADLRSISTGMQLPEIETLTCAEVAGRAVRDYERKTGAKVDLAATEVGAAALPVRITLYRVLQELLANGFRHAGAARQHVRIAQEDSQVVVEVSDQGPGFDAAAHAGGDRGGLAGIRERVQVLGGTFDLRTAPGSGTVVRVGLPLEVVGTGDE